MSRRKYGFAAAFGFAGMGFAAGLGGAQAEALETYLWSERPLMIFAADEDDPVVDRQMTMLADHADGLRARDMAILIVGPSSVYATFGRPAPGADAGELRERFEIPDDAFRTVLVGKDGGVKLASSEPVAAEELFDLIDGMPMRRREMREEG